MNDTCVMTLPDGRDLSWLELGAPDGWPVLGFHGTPGSRLQVALDEAAVQRAGVRLIAPDRPGYGFSSFQPGRLLADWPRDVAALADHLAIERFSVMGISGGGPHSVVCAALLGDRVSSAGLVSGVGPLSDPRLSADTNKLVQLMTAMSRRRSPLLRLFAEVQVALVRRWPTKALELMMKQLPAPDAEALRRPEITALFARDVARASRTTGRAHAQDFEVFAADWGFDLGAISVPVILWHGDADKNVPLAHAQFLHEAIPNSVLHTCAGEGHFLVLNRLEEILAGLASTASPRD